MTDIIRRHPLTVFFVVAIGVTWAVQFTFLIQGWEFMPALLIELVVLLGWSTAITGWTSGRTGIRRLYAGLTRWRLGTLGYLVALAGMPLLTAAVGAATGTLHPPDGGWATEIVTYLFLTVVFGALLANAWEETAWAGFAQTRLMQRHGLFLGSVLTAIPFFLIHLPLAFVEKGWAGTTWGDMALTWGLLAAASPFLRYLVGVLLTRTGGSVLAVALLHASFNASGSLSVVDGWQYLPAMGILTLVVGAIHAVRRDDSAQRKEKHHVQAGTGQ